MAASREIYKAGSLSTPTAHAHGSAYLMSMPNVHTVLFGSSKCVAHTAHGCGRLAGCSAAPVWEESHLLLRGLAESAPSMVPPEAKAIFSPGFRACVTSREVMRVG